jgi:hypothetical protein
MSTADIVEAESSVIPAWHQDVLAERLRRIDNGSEPVSLWAEAKNRIRARNKASGECKLASPATGDSP